MFNDAVNIATVKTPEELFVGRLSILVIGAIVLIGLIVAFSVVKIMFHDWRLYVLAQSLEKDPDNYNLWRQYSEERGVVRSAQVAVPTALYEKREEIAARLRKKIAEKKNNDEREHSWRHSG